jgi:hypothetical protein
VDLESVSSNNRVVSVPEKKNGNSRSSSVESRRGMGVPVPKKRKPMNSRDPEMAKVAWVAGCKMITSRRRTEALKSVGAQGGKKVTKYEPSAAASQGLFRKRIQRTNRGRR